MTSCTMRSASPRSSQSRNVAFGRSRQSPRMDGHLLDSSIWSDPLLEIRNHRTQRHPLIDRGTVQLNNTRGRE